MAHRSVTKKVCPRCRKKSMVTAGTIKAGPKRGRRRVWACQICTYRSLK